MFSLILLAGLLVVAPQEAGMTCTNIASTQTQPMQGPAGVTAVLKVSTEDDHGKNTHLCQADYQLVIIRGAASEPAVEVMASDDAWDRRISLRLSGFSRDGKHIFGTISEKGDTPMEMLFDYETPNKKIHVLEPAKLIAGRVPRGCVARTEVAGTTEGDDIVLQMNFTGNCAPAGRWRLNSDSGRMRRLANTDAVSDLFDAADSAH